jgi:hypothetical protein
LPTTDEVADHDSDAGLADVPELIGGCLRRSEVIVPSLILVARRERRAEDLLIHDGGNDSQNGNSEDTKKDDFSLQRDMSYPYHDGWDDDQAEIRRDIKHHLHNAIGVVGRTLGVRDRKGPILGKGTADDAIVHNLDDEE